VHYALFVRRGFTPSAVAERQRVQGLLVDLNALEADLSQLNA
jgi:hypothetical protein